MAQILSLMHANYLGKLGWALHKHRTCQLSTAYHPVLGNISTHYYHIKNVCFILMEFGPACFNFRWSGRYWKFPFIFFNPSLSDKPCTELEFTNINIIAEEEGFHCSNAYGTVSQVSPELCVKDQKYN